MKKFVFIAVYLLISFKMLAQACCTAGTPLLGSLDMSAAQRGVLQLGLSYEHNLLADVYSGSDFLDDNSRERVTNSYLLEISYGLSDRISVTGLFSYVNQLRNITPQTGINNELSTNGVGDALILIKYNVITLDFLNQLELSLGAGIKTPLGSSDLLSNGILIPADMQPGSGSWDGILWGYFSKGFMPVLSLNFLANISYRINGANKRFGAGSAGYQFGNELITSIGFGYRTNSILDFSLLVRYRHTDSDKFDNQAIPNTGGDWMYIVPGLNIKLSEYLTGRVSAQLPLYRDLQGTQLTTSNTLGISFFYTIFTRKGL